MIIKELIHTEALLSVNFDYTVLQLEKANSLEGKVIFTLCKDLKVGDKFITDKYWSPIWFKDSLQNYFKLMDLKEYFQDSLKATDLNSRRFVDQVVSARYLYSSSRKG